MKLPDTSKAPAPKIVEKTDDKDEKRDLGPKQDSVGEGGYLLVHNLMVHHLLPSNGSGADRAERRGPCHE